MIKKIVVWLMILLTFLAMTSCKKEDEATNDGLLNQELMNLMPDEGFQWAYIGGAEYYHEMILNNITKDDHQAIFKITGEVEDVSGGESNKDYSIEVYYEITNDSIIQRKTEEAMLDSEYDEMTIIKAPLEKGTTWTEEIKDRNGEKQIITAEITGVTETERGMQYEVLYQNKKTDYIERRKIMENLGVIAFSKKVKVDGEFYQYGYALYGKNSGYIASSQEPSEDITDTDDTTSESTDTGTDATDDTTNTDTSDTSGDSSNQGSDTDSTSNDTTTTENDDTPAVDEKEAVRTAIRNFNNAWIDYVNDNNKDFFNYVVKNSTAYNNAINFSRDGLTEEFLKMDIGTPTVNGKVATVSVYEEIQKTTNGEVTVVKYNWLYELSKVDNQWLVRGYTKK